MTPYSTSKCGVPGLLAMLFSTSYISILTFKRICVKYKNTLFCKLTPMGAYILFSYRV